MFLSLFLPLFPSLKINKILKRKKNKYFDKKLNQRKDTFISRSLQKDSEPVGWEHMPSPCTVSKRPLAKRGKAQTSCQCTQRFHGFNTFLSPLCPSVKLYWPVSHWTSEGGHRSTKASTLCIPQIGCMSVCTYTPTCICTYTYNLFTHSTGMYPAPTCV